jgi:phosphoribosylformylglycinamidine synthase
MAQIVEALRGMGDACRALDYPIVSGNVSLYNESKATGGGSAILPTPAIGGVGILADHAKMATIGFKAEGEAIFVIGQNNGHLGQSLWLRELHGGERGEAPGVDLAIERRNAEFVRKLVTDGQVSAVHDVSDGGLLVALAEMALAGVIGASLEQIGDQFTAFGEDQARYVVTSAVADSIQAAGIPMTRIGTTGGTGLSGPGFEIPLTALREASDSFFRDWMES